MRREVRIKTHSLTPNEVRVESHEGMEDELNAIAEWRRMREIEGLDEEDDVVIETSD